MRRGGLQVGKLFFVPGDHLRVEHQTEEGEALRDDENFSHVAAWEFEGVGSAPTLHKEALEFEYVHLAQRSYK